ncbi:hypothetical protein ACF068_22120 [Streptomyces sp. NPDC016309]|uniref:hypothetical protein n=1 Tax=Streptomyces sp. NPDC016309 TaxID=3364965 RepID=UPI00370090DA
MTVHDTARLLPPPRVLRDHCRALALLEAILCRDPAYRHYSFDAQWSRTEELASMSNGSGVLASRPLTDEVVAALNPGPALAGLAGDLAALGRPGSGR